MNRRHACLLGLTVLAVAVVWTPSDARQEVANPQRVSDVIVLARNGDPDAQVTLGGWYFNGGRGVRLDAREGLMWWRLAAEQGHLPAQNGLGGRYYDGRGVVRDEAEAVRWYRMAAEQGDPESVAWLHQVAEQGSSVAQVNLTAMYATGFAEVVRQIASQHAVDPVRWYQMAATQGDAEALSWVRQAARKGLPDAQVALGGMYATGRGVLKNDGQAVRWFLRASEQGNAIAQDSLRLTADQGATAAVGWLRQAAEGGQLDAQVNLADMYATGRGVVQDDGEAVRWFRLAAEKGHGPSMTALAGRYLNGRGVPLDVIEGMRWYRMAAERGNVEVLEFLRTTAAGPVHGNIDAQVALGELYFSGRGVLRDPTEAVRWYRMAAQEGYVPAQVGLADRYFFGRGIAKDLEEAARWYRMAAQEGDVEALRWLRRTADGDGPGQLEAAVNLGGMYSTGLGGVVQDEAEAIRWYHRAAEQGYLPAQLRMGEMYAAGRGTRQDVVEALVWYRRAAEQGDANAQYNLGVAYETGRGVTQDAAEAVRWFRPAAEQGSASAQFALGDMYTRGVGIVQDNVTAYMWLSLAASQEAPLAKQRRTATGVFDRVTEWVIRRVSRRPTYELTSANTVRDEVADRMTPTQITEAQQLVREWEVAHSR